MSVDDVFTHSLSPKRQLTPVEFARGIDTFHFDSRSYSLHMRLDRMYMRRGEVVIRIAEELHEGGYAGITRTRLYDISGSLFLGRSSRSIRDLLFELIISLIILRCLQQHIKSASLIGGI